MSRKPKTRKIKVTEVEALVVQGFRDRLKVLEYDERRDWAGMAMQVAVLCPRESASDATHVVTSSRTQGHVLLEPGPGKPLERAALASTLADCARGEAEALDQRFPPPEETLVQEGGPTGEETRRAQSEAMLASTEGPPH